MDLDLKGKRAIVLGASRGIGWATAEKLAAEGVSVAICARGAETLESGASRLSSMGVQVFHRSVDVGVAGAVTDFIDAAADALGGVDLLVSAASAGSLKGPDQWESSYMIDFKPLVDSITAVTPHMEAAGGGAIVAIASTFAFDMAWPSSPNSYGAFKAALLQHASASGYALAPKGIRVNCVSPGPVEFEDGNWGTWKSTRPELYQQMKAAIPLGRMGQLDEVSSSIVFLLSPRSGYCVGANLVCDGGMTRYLHS